MSFGLPPKALSMMQALFHNHPEIERVQIFGSRVMGNYRPNSDIDLVLYGNNIDELVLGRIKHELDELPFPYRFDVEVYNEINHVGLKEHIATFGKDLYVKK